MEIRKTLKFVTPLDVKLFCQATNTLPRNMGVYVPQDHVTIDAKSIMGMFSLNLSEPVEIQIIGKDTLDTEKINTLFAPWEV